MPFALLYENFADQAVLGGSGWATPLANLQGSDLGLITRSEGAASAVLTIDLGAPRPVGGIAIGPTNLGAGATYRLRAYADAAMTAGGQVYDTGLRTIAGNAINWANPAAWLEWEDPAFWLGVLPSDAPELPLYLVFLLPAASTGAGLAQYWRIDLADPDNLDGAMSFGRLYMGRCYRPSMNYAYDGNEFAIDPLTDITESLGGSESFWERGLRRSFRASWPTLPETEVFDAWVRIALRARTSRQVFVIPEETDGEEMLRKRAFLGRFNQTPRIAQALFRYAATAIDIREVL